MPRVLLDTNVLISYLLRPDAESAVGTLLRAFLAGRFVLLLPEALLEELVVTVREKPPLAQRIPVDELQTLVTLLRQFGETVPRIRRPIPQVTRDPKDDYLLAYALVGATDYLVSGDKDLLALQGQVAGLQLVTPRQAVAALGISEEAA